MPQIGGLLGPCFRNHPPFRKLLTFFVHLLETSRFSRLGQPKSEMGPKVRFPVEIDATNRGDFIGPSFRTSPGTSQHFQNGIIHFLFPCFRTYPGIGALYGRSQEFLGLPNWWKNCDFLGTFKPQIEGIPRSTFSQPSPYRNQPRFFCASLEDPRFSRLTQLAQE